MKYGLGIDTGGTFTDAVIYNFENEEILTSTKSRTTKQDLKLGINNVLNQLPNNLLEEVKIVSLSTTLATNAAVEGKMGRGKLILIGCDEATVKDNGNKYGLPSASDMIFLEGGHNQQGEVIAEPDWSQLEKEVMDQKEKTDGFAIVQLWGMRNPEFENKAKKLITDWTGLPVVCAHELLGDLNFLKRAATTLLNVRLIPIINKFMDAVKVNLHNHGITAPLVIVRGDGSLMSEEFARKRPLETLLSGPAASVVGGINIVGEKDCIILDMGGTTSDLALVNDGKLNLAYGGIDVGEWKTGTKSILLQTIGLGGDSCVRVDDYDQLTIGPERVSPLSWLAFQWPEIIDEIRKLHSKESLMEFVYLLKDISDHNRFSKQERNVASVLKDSPMSIEGLADSLGISIFDLKLNRLFQADIIMKSCITPTDIMHLTGKFTEWNIEAARLGTESMAAQLEISSEELGNRINRIVKQKLYYNIVKMLVENEDEYILNKRTSKQFKELVMLGYHEPGEKYDNEFISCDFTTDFKLIGIGAPVHVYLPQVAEVLDTDCIIPENAAVANAVGAITGNISVQEIVKIKPIYDSAGIKGYNCFSSEGRKNFKKYDEALTWSKSVAETIVRKKAKNRDAGEVKIFKDVDENVNKDILLQTTVKARAIGSFEWL